MESHYIIAMQEQLAELTDELLLIKQAIAADGYANPITYRAAERNLQLLIEACIGIAKQTLKSQKLNVPNEAREAFAKLKSLGLDKSDIPWRQVVGMRNALVHDYLNLDKERIIKVITNDHYLSLIAFANQMLQGTSN